MTSITNHPLRCTIALNALQNVTDPEIGLNIVDLGLIYQLDFDEEQQKVFCSMTLTTQFCPMGDSIKNAVTATLAATFPSDTIRVDIVFTPTWNHEMISPEGKAFLVQ
jgi:metal-sulfur cluster biosynthetic enzyme